LAEVARVKEETRLEEIRLEDLRLVEEARLETERLAKVEADRLAEEERLAKEEEDRLERIRLEAARIAEEARLRAEVEAREAEEAKLKAEKEAEEARIAKEEADRLATEKVEEVQEVISPTIATAVVVEEEVSVEERMKEAERKERLAKRVEEAKESVLTTEAIPVSEALIISKGRVITEDAVEQGVQAYTKAIEMGAIQEDAIASTKLAVQESLDVAVQQAIDTAISTQSDIKIQEAIEVALELSTEAVTEAAIQTAIQTAIQIDIETGKKILPLPPIISTPPDRKDASRKVSLITISSPKDSGKTTPKSKPSIPRGSKVKIHASAGKGWRFDHWEGDIPKGQEKRTTTTITMDQDKFIVGVFKSKVTTGFPTPDLFEEPYLEIGLPKLVYEERVTEREIHPISGKKSKKSKRSKKSESPGSITEVRL